MKYYTSTPNFILDTYQPILKPSEFSILMVIVRQTYGWFDHKMKSHKRRDWISHRLFSSKTGLCPKTISTVIDNLDSRKMIRTSDKHNVTLDKQGRKFANKVFYEILDKPIIPLPKVTKEAKENIRFLTDAERIQEIRARQNFPHQNQNR